MDKARTYIELDFTDLEIFGYLYDYDSCTDLDGLVGLVSDLVESFREDFESKTKDWTEEYKKKIEDEYFKRKHLKQPLRK